MDLSTPNTTGADTLVIHLSQDAWQGDARFTVAVDGQQVGEEFSAATLHGQGSDTLTLRGDWAGGRHDLAITFTNDLWGGTPDTDRNLHVDGVFLNGSAVAGATAEMLSTGTARFGFGDAAPQAMPAAEPAASGAWREVWHESFDSGTGLFSRSWGPGVDTSVPGQLTIRTSADNQDSGAMVPPTGAETGFGYGLYNFTLKTEGVIGVYALTWPGTDIWPGPEMDVLEITPDGEGYFALHWKGENGTQNGENKFVTFSWGDVDLTAVNTFSMLWEHGRLTGFLNGEQRWTTTEHVPLDHAHGGENTAPSVGVQTWWNDGALGGNNAITLYDASYSVIA